MTSGRTIDRAERADADSHGLGPACEALLELCVESDGRVR
jgi:hypothetical protein